MSRARSGLPAALLLCALAAACGTAGEEESASRRDVPPAGAIPPPEGELPVPPPEPVEDLVLITLDTLRADALGFMGNSRVATPVLDRLAEAGWVFENAHAHNVVTLPSHANILTGLHPFQHGVRDNTGFVLPEEFPTAATLLGEAGFATGAFVAAFPLDERFGLGRGFDRYDDDYPRGSQPTEFVVPERAGDQVVARALEWWRSASDRRRFLWVHLYEPHAPYLAPEPFASRYADEPYLGEVAATDAYLAALLEPFLGGRERRALVAVTADHGEALGDHGEVTHGLFAYESTLRVPLVLWWPEAGSGRTSHPARHVDLLPTMLRAAGVEVPAGLPGRPLLEAPGGGPPASDAGLGPALYFESLSSTFNQGFAPLRGVLAGGYKLIALPLPELYDLVRDPLESVNLYDRERERGRRLARLLPEESVWPPRRGEISAEAESALRSLGYLTGPTVRKASYGPEDDPKRLVELDRKVHAVVFLYQQGELAEAERLAREVTTTRPEMGLAWSYLAQVLLEARRFDEAIEVMREAERLGVARDSLLRQLGLSLAEVGRFGEALAVLERFGDSEDPEVLNALGLVLSEAGRQDEARAALERRLETDPSDPVAHQGLALIALRRQDWRAAQRHAETALSANEGLGLAWNYLGTALYNQGRPRPAIEAWERAVAAEADSFDALFNLALVASQIGDLERARRALERFVATAPRDRYGPDIERARQILGQLPAG